MVKFLARVNSVYTGLCWVHVWVESWVVKFWHECLFSVYTGLCWVQVRLESWVVKFWHECSVFTLGGVGYKFGLSLFGTSDQCLQRVVLGTCLG